MKQYNRGEPLIFIHVPKASGLSVKGIFNGWFRGNFQQHYG